MVDVVIPEVGESIVEVTVNNWLKKENDFVEVDEPIAEIETDKVTFELLAPCNGTLEKILVQNGESAKIKQNVAIIKVATREETKKITNQKNKSQIPPQTTENSIPQDTKNNSMQNLYSPHPSPSAEKMLYENEISLESVKGSGKNNQVLKKDVIHFIEEEKQVPKDMSNETNSNASTGFTENVSIQPMSAIRKSIAKHLVNAKQNTAMLTTFNEINMQSVIDIRTKYKDAFLKKYNVKLGFMSFFIKAVVSALQETPSVNSEIQGDSILYKKYYHIGVAVSSEKGLFVPVIRFADKKNFAEIETEIIQLAEKARNKKITLKDLEGGTFTITNGGIYGSMMSTPILNYPQTGILGMHNIIKKPVVINEQIVIRPMMYVALSYDHQVIDGKEAVTFLKTIKEYIEDPNRFLLAI